MSEYLKPTVIQSADLSEGVYAASGSTAGASGTVSKKGEEFWNDNNGQMKYDVTLTGITEHTHIKVTFHASEGFSNAWGGGAAVSKSGNDFIFDIWDASSNFEAVFQASTKSASVAQTVDVVKVK